MQALNQIQPKKGLLPPWDHLALLLTGIAGGVDVNFLGQLSGTDILSVLLLPVVLWWRPRPVGRTTAVAVIMALMWLLSAVFSDTIQGTPFADFSRGWARIVMFAILFLVVSQLANGRFKPLLYFAAGSAAAAVIGLYVSPTELALIDPWKFAISGAITMSALIVGASGWGPPWFKAWGRYVLLLGAAAADLLHNYRSGFGITVIAVSIAGYMELMLRRGLRRITLARLAGLAFLGVLIGAGVVVSYSTLAQSGALGVSAQAKYNDQAAGGAGILLGGRSESMVTLRVIGESPFIGHGSWARSREVAQELIQLKREKRIAIYGDESKDSDLIPSHSFLLGAWVEHGILGALFWVWVLGLMVGALTSLISVPRQYVPFVAYLIAATAWDILFSPFGTAARATTAMALAAAVIALQYARAARRARAGGVQPPLITASAVAVAPITRRVG